MRQLLSNKGFMLLCGLYFIFSIYTSIVHPITTTYVNSLNLPSAYFGFFYATMALGQAAGAFFWGYLSDKIGRKLPIIIGILGYAGAQALFGFVNKVAPLILPFRFLSGFSSSSGWVLFVSLTLDKVKTEDRTNALSLMSGIQVLGAALAYEIGGALYDYAHFSIQGVFITQISVGVLLAFLCLFISQNRIKDGVSAKKSKISFKNLSWIILFLLFAIFLMNIGQININKYLDVIVIDNGYEPSTLGHFVLVTGIVGFFTNLFLVPLIEKAKNIPDIALLIGFLLLSASAVFIEFHLGQANLLVLLYTIHMIYIICKAIIVPLEQNAISKFSNEETRGSIMGIRQMFVSIASMAGPLLASAVYQKGDSLIMTISALFIVVSALTLIPLLFIGKKK